MDTTYKILIADDQPDNVVLLSAVLSGKDYNISIARNGTQALSMATSRNFDLLLLDIAMPGIDGFEICSRLRKMSEKKDIPIIFITAFTETESIVRGFAVGGNDYVTKPFNSEELLSRVKTQLALKQSKDLINEQIKNLNELNFVKDKLFSVINTDVRVGIEESINEIDRLLIDVYSQNTEQIRKRLQNLRKQSETSLQPLEDISDWMRLHKGNHQFKPQAVQLSKIVNGVKTQYEEKAKRKNINLIYDADHKVMLYADSDMLRSILEHLISNGVKFTNTGGDVIISSKESGDMIEITVYDTGIGIKPELQENLFRFDKAFSTVGTSGEKGIGVGLALCKKMVEQHNGKIWVESMPGIGSDFKFTLPSIFSIQAQQKQ